MNANADVYSLSCCRTVFLINSLHSLFALVFSSRSFFPPPDTIASRLVLHFASYPLKAGETLANKPAAPPCAPSPACSLSAAGSTGFIVRHSPGPHTRQARPAAPLLLLPPCKWPWRPRERLGWHRAGPTLCRAPAFHG